MTETLPKFKFYRRDALFASPRLPPFSQRIAPNVTIRRHLPDPVATTSVFGYFFGGGFAFGALENDVYRIRPDFYTTYANAAAGTKLTVPYYNPQTNQTYANTTVEVWVGSSPTNDGIPVIPLKADLRNIDAAAWQHDRDLALAEQSFYLQADHSSSAAWAAYNLQKHQINKQLVANLDANGPESAPLTYNEDGKNRVLITATDIRARKVYGELLRKLNQFIDTKIAAGVAISELQGLIDLVGTATSSRLYDALRSDPAFSILLKISDKDPFDALMEQEMLNALKALSSQLQQEFQQKAVVYGAMGSIVGSSIGQFLGQGNDAKGIVYSSLLGEIGERLAVGLAGTGYAESIVATATQGGLATLPQDVAARAGQATVGSVSSWLTMELGEALGLEGFGAELFQASGSTVTAKVVSNLLDNAIGPANIFNGFRPAATVSTATNVLVAQSVGSFLGSKLGSLVASPQTQAASLLSSVGSSVGSFTGVGIGQTWIGLSAWAAGGSVSSGAWLLGNLVIPGVGAFVGFVLGSLIGNLFGKKKPKPGASAETVLQVPYARYELGTITSNSTGNRDLVTSMASAARDTLNQFIGTVAFNKNPLYVSNLNGLATDQVYGHNGNLIYVKINGAQTNFNSADQAVEFGSLTAIRNTKIVGGDIFSKRALYRSTAPDLVTLAGDIQLASDFRFYAHNRDVVNDLIKGAYSSLTASEQTYYTNNKALIDKILTVGRSGLTTAEQATYDASATQIDKILKALLDQSLANPWIISLQRASELQLDKFAPSDFYGGLRGFVDSFQANGLSLPYEDLTISTQADGIQFTGLVDGYFSSLSNSLVQGRAVRVPTGQFFSGTGAGYANWDGGAAMAGANFRDASTATSGQVIDDFGSSGGSTFAGGDDIALGSAFNDTLQGRTGWDWLDGGGGNDALVGGKDPDVLLGGEGNDTAWGDLGDDYVAGGGGNDVLYGGDGNDAFSGKAGNDSMYGEGGDDTFIVNGDGGAVYDYMDGGAGADTLSFERFGANAVTVSVSSGSYYGDAWTSIENLTGGGGADSLTGSSGSNYLKGGDGADTLAGGAGGADTLEGGLAADSLVGDAGADVTLSYASSYDAIFVDLTGMKAMGGDAEGDKFVNIDNIIGSAHQDMLRGDSAANRLDGGAGDDWIMATSGSDSMDGGDGLDFVDYTDATSAVTLYLGAYVGASITNGFGSAGLASGHTYTKIEGAYGSSFADNITAGAGAQVLIGGKGNDSLGGGSGDDSYVFDRGDGQDVITEDTSGWNTLSFGPDVLFQDLVIGTAGGSGGYLDVYIRGTTDKVRISGNWADPNLPKLKSIDLGGVAKLDLDQALNAPGSTDNADFIYGAAGFGDLILGANGDDTMRTRLSGVDQMTHVFIGGLGNDTAYGSTGDDSYGFDRDFSASQMDYIVDTGGEDTIVFGPSIAAEDLIYEVMNGSLYIGAKEASNPALTASQVSNKILIADGGTRIYNVDSGITRSGSGVVEFITVAGASIDLRKLDTINWHVVTESNPTGPWPIPPIVLDLEGDGIDISTLDESRIVSRSEKGVLTKVAWVGPKDGLLAVDRDGDGAINQLSEISFVQDKKGAKTDLEGLTAWDTNGDGVLSEKDKDWGKLLVWTDKNQNARSTKSELQTLTAAGITAINLKGQATGFDPSTTDESFIQNTFSFTRKSGEEGKAYDVALARQLINAEDGYAGAAKIDLADVNGDGELGRLLNDPKAEAFRAAGKTYDRKQSVDKRTLSYDEVAKAAKLDFTDNDTLDAYSKSLWDYRLDPSKAQTLKATDQKMIDALVAKPASADRPSEKRDTKASLNQAEIAPIVEAVDATDIDSAPVTAPLRPASSAAEILQDALVDGPLSTGDVTLSPVTSSNDVGAARFAEDVREPQAWWRLSAAEDKGPASLGDLMAELERSGASQTGNPEQLQRQALLRQAMAGFADGAGAGVAVWLRGQEKRDTMLATADKPHAALNHSIAA